MTYQFNAKEAQKYGVEEAILIHNIRFWILKNKANEKHFYDNRTWTYNSMSAFTKLFPFWTAKQISRILKSLISQGVLVVGNHNKNKYDRTLWYAFADELTMLQESICQDDKNPSSQTEKSIYQNEKIHLPKWENGKDQMGEPIPDNKPDNKPDINKDFSLSGKENTNHNQNTLDTFENFWSIYPRKVSKKKALQAWKKLKPDSELVGKILLAVKKAKISKEWTKDGGQFIPHPATYLNQERWEDKLTIPFEWGKDWDEITEEDFDE